MLQLTTSLAPVLFIGLHFMASCNEPGQSPSSTTTLTPQGCIQYIVAKDDSLGALRNHACETISLAETIRNYADGMERLDYSDCPPAFATAFKKHAAAWRQMIPFVEKYPDLRGEMHDLFDGFEKGKDAEEFKPLLKNLWDTWGEVEDAMKG